MGSSLTVMDSGGLVVGEVTVDAAGTAEQMSTTIIKCHSVTIRAKAANTGQIYLGPTTVSNAINDGLDANESLSLTSDSNGFDLSNWYLDADTSGEGVEVYVVIGK